MTHNDTERGDRTSPSGPGKGGNCTKLFLQLLLSPNNGWRRLRGSDVTAQDFESQVFYPLLALTAVCQFLILIYIPSTPISLVLQNAIVGFVALFGAYFAALAVSHTILPADAAAKVPTRFYRVFIAASMAVLDFGYMLSLIAPMTGVMMWLGLIYTLYVVCRGVKYLHVPHNERFITSVMACLMVGGLPAAIYVLFRLLMPVAP